MCVAVSGLSRRPTTAWNYYRFDGKGFANGQPADDAPYLAVRDGVKPVVLKRSLTAASEPLPKNTGALAGICFIQSSGGKMAGGHGYLPRPGTSVEIFSGSTPVLSTRTDDSGYFVALLPAGRYRLTSGPFAAETSVEAGTTTLVPLRAGKRMVD
jgi:hypothetical protein